MGVAGRTCLASCPPRLRIDLEARCNIKPPCAYCDFDYVKGREALSDHAFRPRTLIEMGSFFRRAEAVLDCSIGEPLLSRHFEPLAILMDAFGKRFDFTTNGQLLSKRLQEVVLGRNMIVCVSLEAVTAELYSLYRNDKFDVVIDNLSKLCRRKREHGNLPTVIVAYLAMRSNVGTFEKFVDLMKELGVDAIKIRNLNPSTTTEGKDVVRNGRRFVYGDEVLSLPELKAFVDTARAYTQKKGMEFHAEIDFGEFRAHPSQAPICDEPWKTLYFSSGESSPVALATSHYSERTTEGTCLLRSSCGRSGIQSPFKRSVFIWPRADRHPIAWLLPVVPWCRSDCVKFDGIGMSRHRRPERGPARQHNLE